MPAKANVVGEPEVDKNKSYAKDKQGKQERERKKQTQNAAAASVPSHLYVGKKEKIPKTKEQGKNNEQRERLARNASDGRIIKHANPQVHEVKMGKIKPPSLSVHDILKRGTPVMIVKKWERK